MQRALEAAGISTVTLSSIPDLTAAVGLPRLAAIEHPLGYLLGEPGDCDGQRAVLRATLQVLAEAKAAGTVVHLPFQWTAGRTLKADPAQAPPIAKYLLRHPWHIPNLLSRDVPVAYLAQPAPPAD